MRELDEYIFQPQNKGSFASIYDRILERCAPVLFGGEHYHKEHAESTKQAIRETIAEQEDYI